MCGVGWVEKGDFLGHCMSLKPTALCLSMALTEPLPPASPPSCRPVPSLPQPPNPLCGRWRARQARRPAAPSCAPNMWRHSRRPQKRQQQQQQQHWHLPAGSTAACLPRCASAAASWRRHCAAGFPLPLPSLQQCASAAPAGGWDVGRQQPAAGPARTSTGPLCRRAHDGSSCRAAAEPSGMPVKLEVICLLQLSAYIIWWPLQV